MMVFLDLLLNDTNYNFFNDPVEEADHLDWPARMRTVMGTVYCLQYMHELNPPVPHCNLNSKSIFLTDDYAAKVCFTWLYIPNYVIKKFSPTTEYFFFKTDYRD